MKVIKKTGVGLALAILLFAYSNQAESQQYSFQFQGVILKTGSNIPIPGLTVSLVHPVLGRSVPVVSNQFGQFFFYNIPFRNEPYYIEVYWGSELIFRSILNVQSAMQQPVVIFL